MLTRIRNYFRSRHIHFEILFSICWERPLTFETLERIMDAVFYNIKFDKRPDVGIYRYEYPGFVAWLHLGYDGELYGCYARRVKFTRLVLKRRFDNNCVPRGSLYCFIKKILTYHLDVEFDPNQINSNLHGIYAKYKLENML